MGRSSRTSVRGARVCPRGTAARLLALSLSVLALIGIRPAQGEPGDIFTISAPAITDQPPAASDISVGDASVATQTGSLGYSFAVKTPPGRQGMKPHISLAYSSQSPIYGGLASGWTLAGVPMISLDTSRGRIAQAQTYTSSLSGGRPLIAVSELGQGDARYRAANDSSWIRYERHTDQPFYWRAYAPDGTIYYFGHHGAGDNHTTGCTIVSDGYAPLTRASDPFGNLIDYTYRPVPGVDGECRLEAVSWGHNTAAGVGYFAAIELDYSVAASPCEFVGSQTSYRTGVKIVTGTSRLNAIRVAAFPPQATDPVTPDPIPASTDHLRTITLTYSSATADCPAPARHSAFRELLAIQESAVGVDSPPVTLPAVTFQYGDASLEWNSSNQVQVQAPWGAAFENQDAYNLGWGYRFKSGGGWPTVEATMVDVDGDGLLDRLTNAPYYADGGVKFCRARWERNLGRDATGIVRFATNAADPDVSKRPVFINLPTLKWATDALNPSPYAGGDHARVDPNRGTYEQCALNYQRTGYVNSSSNVVCQPGGSACPGTNYCASGTDCTPKSSPVGNTFFAWRWFDVDGDGRTDLIGSPIQGGVHSYNLQWGTGVSGSTPSSRSRPASPASSASRRATSGRAHGTPRARGAGARTRTGSSATALDPAIARCRSL